MRLALKFGCPDHCLPRRVAATAEPRWERNTGKAMSSASMGNATETNPYRILPCPRPLSISLLSATAVGALMYHKKKAGVTKCSRAILVTGGLFQMKLLYNPRKHTRLILPKTTKDRQKDRQQNLKARGSH